MSHVHVRVISCGEVSCAGRTNDARRGSASQCQNLTQQPIISIRGRELSIGQKDVALSDTRNEKLF